MPDLPVPVLEFISSEILERRSPAYLQIDLQGHVTGWGGHLTRYGITNLQQGDFAANSVPFLQDILPAPERPFLLPSLRTESGISADIHIFSSPGYDYVLLLDVSEEISQRTPVQQKAHEFSLFQEGQKRRQPQPALSPAESTNILDTILAGLGIVALEWQENESFRSCGAFPEWFLLLFPEATLDPKSIRFDNRFLFLENFLIDARQFWSQNTPGNIRSGPWIETDYKGNQWDLEATALLGNGRKILVIESLREEFEEKQALIQKGREKALRQRSISRRQKELEIYAERYNALSHVLRDWVIVLDDKGVCLDSTTDRENPNAASMKGKSISEFLPVPVAEQFLKSITKAIQSNELQTLGYQWETGEQPHFFHARFAASGKGEVVCVIREVPKL